MVNGQLGPWTARPVADNSENNILFSCSDFVMFTEQKFYLFRFF